MSITLPGRRFCRMLRLTVCAACFGGFQVTPVDAAASTWANVTPAAIDLDGASFNNDNYGIQDILADPARPSDLYAFTCFQGVWKSVDYGVTWARVNTGTNGSALDAGKLWTAAIDPDASRDPATPPTLWTATGDAAAGVWKSIDGGVSWVSYAVGNTTAAAVSGNSYYANDVYALDVDPYDGQHLIAGFHGFPGISESTDGGQTWTTIAVPGGIGSSLYPFFVQTGLASSTRTTWLTQAQWVSNTAGIWRTSNGGSTWSNVAPANEHQHGSSQIYQAGGGVIYAPSVNPDGVFRSADYGQTWNQVSTTLENAVFGTPNQIYADNSFASSGANSVNLISAPPSGAAWSAMTPVPAMSNGSKRAAVTRDGSGYIIVSGNWLAGIWRYVEGDDIFSDGFE
ncbi:MAG: sialidase family protein [Rudaea sp.]|nr:sialidase family protein [Rudaea sp.]